MTSADAMPRILAVPRAAAQVTMAVLVTGATITAFVLSYRGLHDWFASHGYPAGWAWTVPLIVDAFIAVGELRLFTAAIDGAHWRVRLWAWIITLAGLALSVGGNIGHAQTTDWLTRLGWAWPPLAAAAMLGVGLGSLKQAAASSRGAQPQRPPRPRPRWLTWPAGWWPRHAPEPVSPGEQAVPETSFGFIPDPAAEQPERSNGHSVKLNAVRTTATPEQIAAARAEIFRLDGKVTARQIARDHLASDTSPLGDRRLAGRLIKEHQN